MVVRSVPSTAVSHRRTARTHRIQPGPGPHSLSPVNCREDLQSAIQSGPGGGITAANLARLAGVLAKRC